MLVIDLCIGMKAGLKTRFCIQCTRTGFVYVHLQCSTYNSVMRTQEKPDMEIVLQELLSILTK